MGKRKKRRLKALKDKLQKLVQPAKPATSATTTTTKAPATATTVWSAKTKTCHTDPCQVIPGMWLGSAYADEDIHEKVEVVFPLHRMDGSIWSTGWMGQIVYVPIPDFKALPLDVLRKYAKRAAGYIRAGKPIGIYCMGGHGRTGYFAAAVLWYLAPDQDPVKFLREHYCSQAVETAAQLESLAALTGQPIDTLHKPTKIYNYPLAPAGGWTGYGHTYSGYYSGYGDDYDYTGLEAAGSKTCYNCEYIDIGSKTASGIYTCKCGMAVLASGEPCFKWKRYTPPSNKATSTGSTPKSCVTCDHSILTPSGGSVEHKCRLGREVPKGDSVCADWKKYIPSSKQQYLKHDESCFNCVKLIAKDHNNGPGKYKCRLGYKVYPGGVPTCLQWELNTPLVGSPTGGEPITAPTERREE